jgi:hypothetical protein
MDLIDQPLGPNDNLEDFFAVVKLLVGVSDASQRQPRTVPTDQDSEQGKAAFAVLAIYMRRNEPIPTGVRFMLGDLFDPVDKKGVTRKFVLKARSRGGQADVHLRRWIAKYIFEAHVGQGSTTPINVVLEEASDVFAMDYKTIEKLWYNERKETAANKGVPTLFDDE